jgi:hypothetical protein
MDPPQAHDDRLRAEAGTDLRNRIGSVASQKSNQVHAAAGMVAAFWISTRGGSSE